MRFKGKTAGWFYAFMSFAAAVCIFIFILSVWIKPNIFAMTISILIFASVEPLCLSIVMRNYVELQNEALLIAFGFIKKRIPYKDIAALSPSKDPSSSLAASLDRIKITTKTKSCTFISLMDKPGFFKEMQNRNPNIIVS